MLHRSDQLRRGDARVTGPKGRLGIYSIIGCIRSARSVPASSAATRNPKSIPAYESGFSTSERMQRAFERELGVGPREVRILFGARDAPNTAPRAGRGAAK